MKEKICGFQNATKPRVVDDTKEYKNREEINTTYKGKMKKVINVPVREGKITGSPVVPSFFASCVNFWGGVSIGKKNPSKTGSWGFHSAEEKKIGRKKTRERETKRDKKSKIKNVFFFLSSLSSSSSIVRRMHTALIIKSLNSNDKILLDSSL